MYLYINLVSNINTSGCLNTWFHRFRWNAALFTVAPSTTSIQQYEVRSSFKRSTYFQCLNISKVQVIKVQNFPWSWSLDSAAKMARYSLSDIDMMQRWQSFTNCEVSSTILDQLNIYFNTSNINWNPLYLTFPVCAIISRVNFRSAALLQIKTLPYLW